MFIELQNAIVSIRFRTFCNNPTESVTFFCKTIRFLHKLDKNTNNHNPFSILKSVQHKSHSFVWILDLNRLKDTSSLIHLTTKHNNDNTSALHISYRTKAPLNPEIIVLFLNFREHIFENLPKISLTVHSVEKWKIKEL